MSTLDRRLYAWLAEPDDRRFERAFNLYFSVAFPAVVRHLARLSRWDQAELEDLAQDALLRFFDRVGRARRQASETVKLALTQIRPLDLGPLHQRQVSTWAGDMSTFRTTAMTFRIPEADMTDDAAWQDEIRALTKKIPGLQSQGFHLLHAVRTDLGWIFDVLDDASGSHEADDDRRGFTRGFAEQLSHEVSAGTPRAEEALGRHRDLLPFVEGTASAIKALPRLRVPTNGYLFEIALTIFLDQCKSRGRKKRGGTGVASGEDESAVHPLDSPTLAPGFDFSGEYDHDEVTTGSVTAVVDPTRQLEDAEFLEKFYAYLRRPVDEAMNACQEAQVRGKATAERRKLESLSEKFARTVSVLTLLGEGHTQESTGERLGLTRSQVKYIIELVQESFLRFTKNDRGRPV